ncbi:PREDICTED: UPF0415 protein C7orf25-like [Amphimedon queenslandica]|uniref:DUF1308 domain-containing protein n=1 Tax=Amphimedon queenslandica TaxID=400682 RepID=A0AAN0JTE4_AMPQE|nr:PREDICTED: UPF0415 protein C7orf25-like [Amphimedon queenslandica]|eukprot:XP_019860377.1 PREDICTED: UPF0415 protein C7orf25-like [Amphimedon queenslandica]
MAVEERSKDEILHKFKERQVFAQRLLEEANRLKSEEKILGMQRIEKQIKAEMEMLEKLLTGSQIIKDHHIKSTNLLHLEGVIHIIKNTHFMLSKSKGSLTAVERFFKFTDSTGIVQNTMVDVVCNGGDSVLAEQARQERKDPLWPMLQKATEGKSLLACKTAIDDFKSILSVVAGPSEKERAKELLSRINVVPDQPSERARNLHNSGRIKERAKIIFGTGDSLQAITLTANEGFVRAAAGRGISFNVIVHPCRALAELDYKHSVKTNERRETGADIMPTVLPS